MRDLRTTVMGNVTKDPSRHVYEDGTETAVIRLASTSRYYDTERNEFADRKTEYFSVYARRGMAQNVLASVRKGDPLVVTGRLGSAEWTREGAQGFSMTIQAEAIGHDLSFGRATFGRTPRRPEAPRIDEQTGEVLDDDALATGGGASTTMRDGGAMREDGTMMPEGGAGEDVAEAPF